MQGTDMDKAFEMIVGRFESFLARSVVPLSIFATVFFVFDALFAENMYLKWVYRHAKTINDDFAFFFLFGLVLTVGFGFMVSTVQQLMDEFNKKNFEVNIFPFSIYNDRLSCLRKKVQNLYGSCDYNDYLLYLWLRNELKVDVKYVDEVRGIYTLAMAFIFSILLYLYRCDAMLPDAKVILGFLFIALFVYLGVIFARIRYRSRNIRIYIDILKKNMIFD